MKEKIITEIVEFNLLETTANEDLLKSVKGVFKFHEMQDGFINSELIRSTENNNWMFIHHYESMDKIKAVGPKIATTQLFDGFKSLVDHSSVKVSFFEKLMEI